MQFYKLHTKRMREKRLKHNPYKRLIKIYNNFKKEKIDFIKN